MRDVEYNMLMSNTDNAKRRILMCQPDFFDIEYEINPWMHTDNQVNPELAGAQWWSLQKIYKSLGYQVELVEPIKHLPDMVFTANGALMVSGKVMLPRFKHPERQPETEQFQKWFEDNADRLGVKEIVIPEHDFEGEGDALVFGDMILAGYGFRSSKESHQELDKYFDETVISLHLQDSRFYHLDTCLTILDDQTVAYFPEAFDENSRNTLNVIVPRLIEATEKEAEGFGLNAYSDGKNVTMPSKSASLIRKIEKAGYTVHPTSITEYQKSGGGVKCLTLELRS